MSTYTTDNNRRTDHRTNKSPVRHTKEDALTDLEFELLIEASYELERFHDLETRFILLVAGRLGLRRGEIAHMREEWIDWRKQRINIPRFEPCRKGRDGGVCGHCRQLAQQRADHNEDVSVEQALEERWSPKTEMAIRSVPFGFIPRAEIVLEQYFEYFDEWMYTSQAINRRINWVQEESAVDRNVYAHSLRATAATYHAGRGLGMLSLQSLLGWCQPSTAMSYIAQSAENLDRELFMTHS